MLSRSSRPLSRPGYLEAYARISIGGLMREGVLGRDHLLWRDRHDGFAGAAMLRESSPEALVLSYCTTDLPYEAGSEGELGLSLVWKGSAEDNHRPYACCPECPRHVDVLVLKDEVWACALCHRLKHRTAMIRKEIRWAEEATKLDMIMEASVTSGLSRRQLAETRARRNQLRSKLGDRQPTANASYLRVLHIEYVSLPGGWLCNSE